MRGKAPHRIEIAPERPDFLAALLARAETAKRRAGPQPRWTARRPASVGAIRRRS